LVTHSGKRKIKKKASILEKAGNEQKEERSDVRGRRRQIGRRSRKIKRLTLSV